jgi:Tol biopolymer transport system component
VYVRDSKGSGLPRRRGSRDNHSNPQDRSRDGKYLVVSDVATKSMSLSIVPLDGSAISTFRNTPHRDRHAQFCPTTSDWIAYVSEESGRPEVYIEARVGGRRVQVSTAGGVQPRWRGDARELYYLAPDGKLMAAPIEITSSEVRAETPRPLFMAPHTPPLAHGFAYDVTRDGARFVFGYLSPEEGPRRFNVVLNWRPSSPNR